MAGLIAAALGGGLEGLGKSLVDMGKGGREQLDRENLLRMHAEENRRFAELTAQLSRETHGINAEGDLARLPQRLTLEGNQKVDVARRSPHNVTEGTTVVQDGKAVFTAPKTAPVEAEGQASLREAQANLAQAQADYWAGAKTDMAAARAASAGKGKESKPIGPAIKVMKGENGDYMVDTNSGAIGVPVPGTPAKESVWHLFKANEPATPEKLAHTIWSTADGQPLPGGPFSLYKQLPVNAAGQPGAPVSPAQGQRPPISSFGAQPAAPRPAATPSAQARPQGVIEGANENSGPNLKLMLPFVLKRMASQGDARAQQELDRRANLYRETEE